jgi:hypothetical protein
MVLFFTKVGNSRETTDLFAIFLTTKAAMAKLLGETFRHIKKKRIFTSHYNKTDF